MQLSERTIKVLENFVGINGGIVIRKTPEGATKSKITTIDRQTVVYAEAEVDEVFNTNVCLYDLKAFLSVVSSLENPEIDLANESLTITSGGAKASVTYADPAYVTHPEKEFVYQEPDFSFELTQDQMVKILNMGNILTLPHLRLYTKDGKVFAQATDAKNPNSNTFDIDLGEVKGDFDVYIKRDNLKMLPGDYKVDLKVGAFAGFTNLVTTDLFYCTGLELINK